jgi:acetyltransferase-like isoleucine patch superfamily enzyme
MEARHPSAAIQLEDGVWSNNNLSIICSESLVFIGRDTLLGWGVEISDCDFHPIDPSLRKVGMAPSQPVVIGERVWVGSRVTILKGVEIGQNSIIAAGAVVARSIPGNSIAAGVPARVVAKIGAD